MGYSFGDGVNFPEQLYNEDTHTLLGNGAQQWGDETELGSAPYMFQSGILDHESLY